ncbi:MAG: hypothetical protein ACRD2A_22740 [Vicinamibacterales bacterium]
MPAREWLTFADSPASRILAVSGIAYFEPFATRRIRQVLASERINFDAA